MTDMNLTISDDGETVTLLLHGDPPHTVVLKAADVEKMIDAMKKARAQMKPIVPLDYSFGQVFETVADPAWRSEPDALEGNSVLHLRDPGLGWVHFLLPRNEAIAVAEILEKQANLPPPQVGKKH